MSALDTRRQADRDALARLIEASHGQLDWAAPPSTGTRSNSPVNQLELELRVPLSGGPDYPQQQRTSLQLAIDLPRRYPFEPPVVRIRDAPLLHPNVFDSGVVCIGSRWRPGEGLDLFVKRVARLLCFDPLLVNLQSIANAPGAQWYRTALRRSPNAFPTAHIDWPIEQTESPPERSLRSIRACPACGQKLRLPSERTGAVECPRCQHLFDTRT